MGIVIINTNKVPMREILLTCATYALSTIKLKYKKNFETMDT